MGETGGLWWKWRMEYLWSPNPATYIGLHVDGWGGGLCRKWRMEYLQSLNPATYIGLHVDGWDRWAVPEVEDGVLTIPQPRYLHWASCWRMRRVGCARSGGCSTYDPSTATYTGFHVMGETGGLWWKWGMEYLWSPNPATYIGLHVDGWGGGLCRKWRMEYLWPPNPATYIGLHVDGWGGGLCRKWRMEYLQSLNPATYIGLHVDGWDRWAVPEVEDGVLTISQSH